jgi:hypothetical protein
MSVIMMMMLDFFFFSPSHEKRSFRRLSSLLRGLLSYQRKANTGQNAKSLKIEFFLFLNDNIFSLVRRLSEKTQEARRVLLSDINFTSMVPELSRSADHLCQQKINEEEADEDADYFKGTLLKTPDYRITPSTSTPGVSQWTVNESTTQTEGFWHRGDSFDSTKSYSLKSGHNSSTTLNKHHRSRSVPSIRCAICKQNHGTIKPSESMHYTKTVTFRGNLIFCSSIDTCADIFPIH